MFCLDSKKLKVPMLRYLLIVFLLGRLLGLFFDKFEFKYKNYSSILEIVKKYGILYYTEHKNSLKQLNLNNIINYNDLKNRLCRR